jgi:beta-galactosidase
MIAAVFLLASADSASSRSASNFVPHQMDMILYGTAYYTGYMPYERLEKDMELMQQAGLTVVRVGETSWGLREPAEGQIEFAWMDRVTQRTHQAEIRVIMGTSTYPIPG